MVIATTCRVAAAMGLALSVTMAAPAEEPAARLTMWDLRLGMSASEVPSDAFIGYACGTNGGPPGRPLSDFTGYARCAPEPSGLREVYFRYDDELEYVGRAHRSESFAKRYGGTTLYDFPVIVSALFTEAGILKGLRVVTDPRTDINTRKQEYALANFLMARYGAALTCADLPPEPGETPVGSEFIKLRCTGTQDGRRLTLESRFYRRPGQAEFSTTSGTLTQAQWESSARFEMALAD
jgi:hypothetical protein